MVPCKTTLIWIFIPNKFYKSFSLYHSASTAELWTLVSWTYGQAGEVSLHTRAAKTLQTDLPSTLKQASPAQIVLNR